MCKNCDTQLHMKQFWWSSSHEIKSTLPRVPKKWPLKNFFSNFSRTIEIWYKIVHTSSFIQKSGKYNYIIYISDKIRLHLVMTT